MPPSKEQTDYKAERTDRKRFADFDFQLNNAKKQRQKGKARNCLGV